MAQGLGALFITAALGPVNYAGKCIMARKVDDGLQQLTSQQLLSALERGIQTVVAATGLPRRYVAGLLPMVELTALCQRIGSNQETAFAQWRLHTGHIGGLLEGVADLTIDGRPPDAGLCVLRLSRKMQLDKELSTPLRELAEDLDRWRQAIEACRGLIDDGNSLKNAHQQRRILRLGAIVAGVLAIAVVVVWLVRVQRARSRVDTLLGQDDPCLVEQLDKADVSKASSEQEATIAAHRERCDQQREEERRREEEEKREEQRKREEERKREEREARCAKLAEALDAGGDVSKMAGDLDRGGLLTRIAQSELEPGDISSDIGPAPCAGTPAAPRIAGRYAEAVLSSAGRWLRDHIPSKSARALAVAGKEQLSARRKQIFGHSVEQLAQHALRKGKDDQVAHAARLCRFAEALEAPVRQHCRATMGLAAEVPR